MQQSAFEAALRLILPGPADQPLMRILRIAMDIADCPTGLIGVRLPDRFQTIVSSGIALANFRLDLPRSSAIAARLLAPCIIEDASGDADFADHPYVAGAASWRFIASAPLPLSILPFDVVLNCADPRIAHARRPDMLARLEECAAIAADELRLIGDIALQSERIAEVHQTSAMRRAGVLEARMPLALVGEGGRIDVANPHFRALLGMGSKDDSVKCLADLFPMHALMLAERLDQVFNEGTPANAIEAHRTDRRKTYLLDIIRVVSSDSSMPMALCTVTDRTRTYTLAESLSSDDTESSHVVASFLLDTLVTQKRLLRRGPVPYHALRRWRAAVKDTQLAALKALKGDPSAYVVDRIADELAVAARALFGERTMAAVVPVPCGNSGPGCLSDRLAEAVAARLALPIHRAFASLPPSGGSHPKGNLRRAKMQLTAPINEPVLLIDDVATSGAHLAEAALALKQAGTPAVLPLAWIAEG